MRVLLTRSRQQGLRTAAALARFGHEGILAPLLDIVSVGTSPPEHHYDAVLATSAWAIECIGDKTDWLRQTSLFCVGERTAATAMEAGFAHVTEPLANAHALAGLLRERFGAPARFLYLAGHDRKPDLEAALAQAGHRVEVHIVYEARAAIVLPPIAAAVLRDGTIDAVLHYSRRSAQAFADLTRQAGLWPAAMELIHACISVDAAAPLAGCVDMRIAKEANEAGVFAALGISPKGSK